MEGQLSTLTLRHPALPKVIKGNPNGNELQVSTICSAGFASSSGLKKHTLSHSNERKHKCQRCDKLFKTKVYLNNHIKGVHIKSQRYPCTFCGKTFGYQKTLSAHKKIHLTEPPHKCNICGKAYRERRQLEGHVNKHNNKKDFKCSQCHMKFFYNKALLYHNGTVNSPPKYNCPFCDRGFASICRIENHIRGHIQERPFACPICQSSYGSNDSLQKHLQLHRGSTRKIYKCQVCFKTFRSSKGLSTHIRLHTGELPYSCKYCGESFKQKDYLKQHVIRRHGTQPSDHSNLECCLFCKKVYLLTTVYSRETIFCSVCGSEFGLNGDLKKHLIKHTNEIQMISM
ncbi:putative zinc finger protein [Orchesella cincta]|uniref:Putative zinc finger protein n=1 Tax=Orchesella cincta TaxID=48709 RepID=A0A1D2MDP7_ORCCI|nr:putative zinc finger protein [Orchesella cincta]